MMSFNMFLGSYIIVGIRDVAIEKKLMRIGFCGFAMNLVLFSYSLGVGPSIKYVTLEGEGIREGVTVCYRGRGVKSM